ncbi:RNA polymerase recycling motor HelD [Alicyclobacillus fastidiosus]|uniref:RNA polymerase recycling motor HelD n=1 Tax=Alicyclobacillus fastidiosus TaxID=392011 RepID=A0ABV5AEC7_9BACL|nr:RNA polymerase recycling motor HelD [Alicyclobacillus fastidiosus]WEH09880.1 RNA polymerase recycling motor HelD [Alicyclobacillus fastidiosus]
MASEEWREEQQYVDHVTRRIHERVDSLQTELGGVKEEVVQIRRNFWDDVTVNVGNVDDITETHFAIRQQAELLSERERRYTNAHGVLKTLTRLLSSPFFGRIDFVEQGSKELERIYIGIGSFRDEETDEFLVYDWRAPISSLYYDHIPGPVSFEAPAGEISGEMTGKRQYVIRHGKIEVMFDAAVTIGDELLMQALGRHADAQMKSIVATIQREQNEIIRNDTSSMLIVQGAAGSGKTSAALQRVAYLLYKHRGSLEANQMVLFSPNPMFNSYVSTVLPELGEENMQQTTFQDYLQHRLGRLFELEDPFDHLEYLLTQQVTPQYETRLEGIRFKSTLAFSDALRRYVDLLLTDHMLFKSVRFRDKVVVSRREIREHFYAFEPSLKMHLRMDQLRKWVLERVDACIEEELHEPWVEDEVELLDHDDYQRAHNQVSRMKSGSDASFDDFAKEREILSRMVVNRRMAKVKRAVKRLAFVDVKGIYRQFFTDDAVLANVFAEDELPSCWREICQQTIEGLDERKLAYEDATPFLYLKELIQGMAINTAVKHLIIDEAQDYSLLQLEVLRRLFPRSRMTALGDLNQSVFAHTAGLGNAQGLVTLYGEERTQLVKLRRSYRSTEEIVRFTRGMIAGGEEIIPFERRGEKPKVVVLERPATHNERVLEEVKSLEESGYSSIAVICKSARESKLVYDQIADALSASLITKETATFVEGIVIIPAYLAKGVEFDAVVIYDGSDEAYHRELERQLFYTACTRAMHELCIVVPGRPSRFITSQQADTYALHPVN